MALAHYRAARRTAINDPTDKAVLCTIAADIGHNGEPCWTALRTIAEACAISKDAAARAVKRLAQDNWLTITRQGRGQVYALGHWCDITTAEPDNHNPSSSTPPLDGQTMEQRLSQVEHQLSQIVAGLSQNSPQLSWPSLDTPSLSRSNTSIEVEVGKGEGDTLPLRWGVGQFSTEFNGHMPTVWPLIQAFQRHCDLPSLDKFNGNIWEAIGYNITAADVAPLAAELRHNNPTDNVWPSNILSAWRKKQRTATTAAPASTMPELLTTTL